MAMDRHLGCAADMQPPSALRIAATSHSGGVRLHGQTGTAASFAFVCRKQWSRWEGHLIAQDLWLAAMLKQLLNESLLTFCRGWQAARAAQQAAVRQVAATRSQRCLHPASSVVLQGTAKPQFVNPSGALQAAVGQVSAVARGWNGTLWIFHRGERVWDEDSFSADGRRITYNTPIAADTVVQIDQVGPSPKWCSTGALMGLAVMFVAAPSAAGLCLHDTGQ